MLRPTCILLPYIAPPRGRLRGRCYWLPPSSCCPSWRRSQGACPRHLTSSRVRPGSPKRSYRDDTWRGRHSSAERPWCLNPDAWLLLLSARIGAALTLTWAETRGGEVTYCGGVSRRG